MSRLETGEMKFPGPGFGTGTSHVNGTGFGTGNPGKVPVPVSPVQKIPGLPPGTGTFSKKTLKIEKKNFKKFNCTLKLKYDKN